MKTLAQGQFLSVPFKSLNSLGCVTRWMPKLQVSASTSGEVAVSVVGSVRGLRAKLLQVFFDTQSKVTMITGSLDEDSCHLRAMCVCVRVCVCVNPWAKGSPPPPFPPSPPFPPRQGVSHAGACSICGPLHATKLRPQMGRDQGRLILYLQINTLTPTVHPAAVRWFHGFSFTTALPQLTAGFQPTCNCASADRRSADRFCRQVNNICSTPSSLRTLPPCVSLIPSLTIGKLS